MTKQISRDQSEPILEVFAQVKFYYNILADEILRPDINDIDKIKKYMSDMRAPLKKLNKLLRNLDNGQEDKKDAERHQEAGKRGVESFESGQEAG